MANSYVEYVGDGANTTFAVPFPYIDQAHVTVLVSDVATAFTWLTSSSISITPAPALAGTVRVRRTTPTTQLVTFTGGNLITATNLNLLARQALYRSVEAEEAQPLPTMPAPENRESTLFSYDSSGVFELTPVASIFSVSGQLTTLPDNAVSTSKIFDGAVTTPKLGDASVSTVKLIDGAVSNAKLASVAGFSLKGQLLGSGAAAPVDLSQEQALAGLMSFASPGHRLTLTTALSVTPADVSGVSAATVFWTPHRSNVSPIYKGTLWGIAAISEKSFVLDVTNFLSGKNHDIFLDYNAGTPRLLASSAWTNDTTRADAISRDATYGWWVNNASITCRISNNGGTVAKGAGTLLYLGTIRCAANGQAEDSHAKRFSWNTYNRVMRAMRGATETADSWSNNSTTTRQANANTANQLDMVRGLDEDAVGASVSVKWANSTVGETGIAQIGLDSTTVMAPGCVATNPQCQVANLVMVSQAEWRGHPGIGRRFLAWLEKGTGGGGTQTWSGDGANPSSFQSGIVGWGMA